MNRILFALLILLSSYSSPKINTVGDDEWIITCAKMKLDTVNHHERYLFCLKNPKDGTLVKMYCNRYCNRYYMDNDFSDGSELKDSAGVFLVY